MDPNLLSEAELQALLQDEAPEHDEEPQALLQEEAREHDEEPQALLQEEAREHDEEPLTLPAFQPPDEFQRAEGLAEVAELKEVVRQLQIRMEFLEQLLQGHVKEADAGRRGMGTGDSTGQTRRSSGTAMPSNKASVSDGKPLVGLPSRKIRHSRRGG
jgi:hypothetical protein